MSSLRAAARLTSTIRPLTNGPRLVIRTVTFLLLRKLITLTIVPNGSVQMRGCHLLRIITLAAGCLSALELFAIP